MEDSVIRTCLLQHIFRKTKPKDPFLLEEEEEEEKEKEEEDKKAQIYWEDFGYLSAFFTTNSSLTPIIEFIEEQTPSLSLQIEEKRQLVLSLLRTPLSLVEKHIAHYEHLRKEELYLRRLYKDKIRMSDWTDFFPSYNWEETTEEEKIKQAEKEILVKRKEQLFHSFISKLDSPWYLNPSFIEQVNKSGTCSSLVNQLFIPEIAKIILGFLFPCDHTKDINCFPQELKDQEEEKETNINNGFYRIQWTTHPQRNTYCWSIKTDYIIQKEENNLDICEHPFSLFHYSIVDLEKKEIGGEIQRNSLSELLLSSLCFSEKEFEKNIDTNTYLRRSLVLLLVQLSFSFVYNINYKDLIGRIIQQDQKYAHIIQKKPKQIKNKEESQLVKDFKEIIPWIKFSNISYPFVVENKLVTWSQEEEKEEKLSYRVDISKSDYSQGKFYYWSLSFYKQDLITELNKEKEYFSRKERNKHKRRNEIHPLKLVHGHWVEREHCNSFYHDKDYASSGTIVVVNDLSTLCLKWLGLSNEELDREINSPNKEDIFKYRQCMIDYLIFVTA